MKFRKLFAAVLALCCMMSMFSFASAEEGLKIVACRLSYTLQTLTLMAYDDALL